MERNEILTAAGRWAADRTLENLYDHLQFCADIVADDNGVEFEWAEPDEEDPDFDTAILGFIAEVTGRSVEQVEAFLESTAKEQA